MSREPRATNTWRITGSTSLVRSDRPALLVGTSRQPSSTWPSAAIARSISCSHAIRDAGSCGRNTMPTPYWPIAGSVMPSLPQARRRNASGSWIRMPAPSPCSGSAPVAPRCVRFSRIRRPCVTIAWLLRPLMLAMKPRPQASCSFARVVQALGDGRPGRAGGTMPKCCSRRTSSCHGRRPARAAPARKRRRRANSRRTRRNLSMLRRDAALRQRGAPCERARDATRNRQTAAFPADKACARPAS